MTWLKLLFLKLDRSMAFMKTHTLYQLCRKKIKIPILPSFGGSDISFLSMYEQFIPPVIAGMNSMVIPSSNRLRWLEMLGIVLT